MNLVEWDINMEEILREQIVSIFSKKRGIITDKLYNILSDKIENELSDIEIVDFIDYEILDTGIQYNFAVYVHGETDYWNEVKQPFSYVYVDMSENRIYIDTETT